MALSQAVVDTGIDFGSEINDIDIKVAALKIEYESL